MRFKKDLYFLGQSLFYFDGLTISILEVRNLALHSFLPLILLPYSFLILCQLLIALSHYKSVTRMMAKMMAMPLPLI